MNILQRGRFQLALSGFALVILIGTLGYAIIEDWSLLDSLFMTITTISTVGYEEVHPLSTAGQIFSMFLIVTGVGITFYTVTILVEYITEGHFVLRLGRRKVKEQISKLKDHYIVCGYGRVGREAARTIRAEGKLFLIIDNSEAAVQRAGEDGFLFLLGDVTTDRILSEAGIDRARALIAAVGNDADNVYVTLSARGLRPDIFISARASGDESEDKLRRAGADQVVFPQKLGGRRLAMTGLRPHVVDFIETTVYNQQQAMTLEAISVTSDSPVAGKTIQEGQSCCGGGSIVAMRKRDGYLITNPPPSTVLEIGDEVIIIGTKDQLRIMEGSLT